MVTGSNPLREGNQSKAPKTENAGRETFAIPKANFVDPL